VQPSIGIDNKFFTPPSIKKANPQFAFVQFLVGADGLEPPTYAV
jgi:hypothetical protein